MSSIVECCREGVAKRSRLSLDLEFNIPRMYYLMSNSFVECFVHYLMNSNCTCARSTTLDNFALDQTSLDKKQCSLLHSTRWPNALDISLNMHVERCIVKSRERLARALGFEWNCCNASKLAFYFHAYKIYFLAFLGFFNLFFYNNLLLHSFQGARCTVKIEMLLRNFLCFNVAERGP